jgi:CubicO group peptidase (beta-lactamase class C family)
MIDHVPLAHAPGTISEYLNFGYLVLGRVIEEVTGLSYENAVGQHVLGPCGIVDMHIAIHGDEMHELVQLPEDKDDGT